MRVAFGDMLGVTDADRLATAEGGDGEGLDQTVIGVGLD